MDKLKWLDIKEMRYSKNLSSLTTDKITKSLVKKKTAPKGRFRDFYGGQNNADVTKLIFKVFIEKALEHVINGGIFVFPLFSQPHIYVDAMPIKSVKKARQEGKYRFIDLRKTKYNIYTLKFSFGPNSNKRELDIITTKRMYRKFINNQNSGMTFPKIPRINNVKKHK